MLRRLAVLLFAVVLGTVAVTGCQAGPVVAPAFCSAANTADGALALSPGQAVPFNEPGPCIGVTRPSAATFALPTAGTYKVTFKGSTAPTTALGALAVELNDVLTTVSAQVETPGSPLGATGVIVVPAGSTLRLVSSGSEPLELATGRSIWITVQRIG